MLLLLLRESEQFSRCEPTETWLPCDRCRPLCRKDEGEYALSRQVQGNEGHLQEASTGLHGMQQDERSLPDLFPQEEWHFFRERPTACRREQGEVQHFLRQLSRYQQRVTSRSVSKERRDLDMYAW